MCAHHITANPACRTSGESPPRSGTASTAATNAPGWSPCAANSNASASSSVSTTPPIIPRITSASRLNVSRRGRVTSRRKNAQPIETSTMTATTFCIALTRAQSSPSNGIDSTCSITPPVTTFAVPMVSSTKPQKMPACIRPARASLNIFVWMNAYWTSPTNRRGMSANGLGPWARTAAKTRRWRAIARQKNTTAPQNRGKTSG